MGIAAILVQNRYSLVMICVAGNCMEEAKPSSTTSIATPHTLDARIQAVELRRPDIVRIVGVFHGKAMPPWDAIVRTVELL
jgi:hypothetical protein